VLVTRPRPAGQKLAELLEAAGLRVHLISVLEIVPPVDASPLNVAAARLAAGAYDWVVLTSANGVRALSAALARVGGASPGGEAEAGGAGARPVAKVAVVGAATAVAVRQEGWGVELVPERYTAEALLEAFADVPLTGKRMLLPAAEAAREVLPEGLHAFGAAVDVVVAYRAAVAAPPERERLRALLRDGLLDLVTLASPSAAEGLLDLAGPDVLAVPAAVIGPVTAEAARALGYGVVAEAEPHTAEGLVSAVAEWARASRPGR
jgi:uroporphyrinogen-III synthase